MLIGLLTSKGSRCEHFAPPPTLHGKIKPKKGKGGGKTFKFEHEPKVYIQQTGGVKLYTKLGEGCIETLNLNNFR